jgi:hypothetical protein
LGALGFGVAAKIEVEIKVEIDKAAKKLTNRIDDSPIILTSQFQISSGNNQEISKGHKP